MSQLGKGLIYSLVFIGGGWALMKVFTPSEDKMRETLGVKDKSSGVGESRQRTSEIMTALRREAGMQDSDTGSKKR